MAAETQVRATGNAESIHIQRDPWRGRRGYYIVGGLPGIDHLTRPPYDPETDCPDCEGKKLVLNDAVNKHRSHYMQWHNCPPCKGTGRKQDV